MNINSIPVGVRLKPLKHTANARCDAMSADGPFAEDLDSVLLRSRTFTDRRCFNIQISPLPCRRTSSVISEFIPLTPFRSKSARPNTVATSACSAPAMQHHQRTSHNHNVGVARFFDWSEQDKEECLSVSRLYRELAVGSVPRSLSEKVRPRGGAPNAPAGAWTGAGGVTPRVNPGRMFLRDKGMLTKGEREIIEGIYRNRGDMSKREPAQVVKSDFVVRSHHDAWLVGKSGLHGNKPSTEIPREPPPQGSLMEVTAPSSHLSSEYSSASSPRAPAPAVDSQGHQGHGRTTCAVCLREQQQLQQHQQQQHHHQQHGVHQTPQGRHKNSLSQSLPAGSILRPKNLHEAFRPKGAGGGGGGREDDALIAPPTTPSFMGPAPAVMGGYDFKVSSFTNIGSNASSSTSSPSPNAVSTSNTITASNNNNNSHSNKLLARRRDASLTTRYDPGLTMAINQAPVFRFDDQLGNSPSYENDHAGGRGSYGGGGGSGACGGGGREGGELWSDGESSQDSDGSRKKLQVKVYLPKVGPEPADEEVVARNNHFDVSGGNSRPILARRERPLSHSDLRHGERHSSEPEEEDEAEEDGHRTWRTNGGRADIKTNGDNRHRDGLELGKNGNNGRTTMLTSSMSVSKDADQSKHERKEKGMNDVGEAEKNKRQAVNTAADCSSKLGAEDEVQKSTSRHSHQQRLSNSVRRKHSGGSGGGAGGGKKGDVISNGGPSSSSSPTCWSETDSNHSRDSPIKRTHGVPRTVTIMKAESDARTQDE